MLLLTLKLSVCALTSAKENQGQSNSQGNGSQVNGLQTEELTQLREEVEELRKQHSLLQTQLGDKDALISSLVSIFFLFFLSLCVLALLFWGLIPERCFKAVLMRLLV